MITQRIKANNLFLESLAIKKNRWIKLRTESQEKDYWIIDDNISIINEKINQREKRLYFLKKFKQQIIKKENALANGLPLPKILEPEVDLTELRNIPIVDILRAHGLAIYRCNRFLAVWRGEKNPSCDFNPDKNLWCDRGNGNQGGSTIDLYMAINECNLSTAIKELKSFV